MSGGERLRVEGGTLLDPATGEVTEEAVVVIRDGRVRAAGARARVEVPDDVPRLDAYGRWVLPGLVDAHIHLNTAAEAGEAFRKGDTSARGGKGVVCHGYSERGCDDAVRAGIRSLEHGVFVSERTLHDMRRRGTCFTPRVPVPDQVSEAVLSCVPQF